jgi:microcystin-dependent protein
MSDDVVILGDMITPPSPAGGGPPASFDTGTVTQAIDATHVKVDLGDREVKTFLPATLSGTAPVGATVSVRTQENTYAVDAVIEGAGAGTVPVGSVVMWATATAPAGWLKLDGSTFDQNEYPLLFDLLGSTTLPNMTDRAPVGPSGTKTVKSAGGAASVTLTEAQLPSHDHTMTHTHTIAHTHQYDHYHNISHTHEYGYHAEFVQRGTGDNVIVAVAGTPYDDVYAASTGISASPNTTTTGGASTGNSGGSSAANTGAAGSGSAISVQNPYVALNFIIKAK